MKPQIIKLLKQERSRNKIIDFLQSKVQSSEGLHGCLTPLSNYAQSCHINPTQDLNTIIDILIKDTGSDLKLKETVKEMIRMCR